MTKKDLIQNGLKYKFQNEVQNNKHILTLSGVVAKPSVLDILFEKETINAKDIAEALDDVDTDILIRLNSGGGDAFEGIEIYNYLKNHSSHVTIEVTALAASAASIICMAGDEIVMDTGSSMMMHQASTFAYGDKTDIRKTLNALKTVDGSLVDIYSERTGLEKTELDKLLENETWFTADEAVEKGFADRKSSRQAETPAEGDYTPEATEENTEEQTAAATVAVKITDMDEFKEILSGFQEQLDGIKNLNNEQKTKEPEAKKGFERFLF